MTLAPRKQAPPPARITARRRASGRSGADRAPRPGGVYVLPAALFFGCFAVLPLLLVVALSFTDWQGTATANYIGVDNWRRLLDDPLVVDSTQTTLLLTAAGWLTQTPLSIAIGVWAAGRQRNRAILSSLFFLPLLLSSAAIALMWNRYLDPNFGLAAELGPYIGFPDGNIMGRLTSALSAFVFVVGWQFFPFLTLLYQAAARNIPSVLYDAATVDGANRWQVFWRITLPQLRNAMVTSSTIMVVGSLTWF